MTRSTPTPKSPMPRRRTRAMTTTPTATAPGAEVTAPSSGRSRKPKATPKTDEKKVSQTVTIDFLTEDTFPIAQRIKEIAKIYEIEPEESKDILTDSKAVIEVLKKLVETSDGDRFVYVCEKEPVVSFVKTRRSQSDKETESPYEFLARNFKCDVYKPIMISDKQLFDKAVEILKGENDRYDANKFVRDALRTSAQTIISTWAAREVRVDWAKDDVKLRSGNETENQIRVSIQKLRLARASRDSWAKETPGNVPVITHTYIMRDAKVGAKTVKDFLKAVRDSDAKDKYEDVYETYADWRNNGRNPDHAVK